MKNPHCAHCDIFKLLVLSDQQSKMQIYSTFNYIKQRKAAVFLTISNRFSYFGDFYICVLSKSLKLK